MSGSERSRITTSGCHCATISMPSDPVRRSFNEILRPRQSGPDSALDLRLVIDDQYAHSTGGIGCLPRPVPILMMT